MLVVTLSDVLGRTCAYVGQTITSTTSSTSLDCDLSIKSHCITCHIDEILQTSSLLRRHHYLCLPGFQGLQTRHTAQNDQSATQRGNLALGRHLTRRVAAKSTPFRPKRDKSQRRAKGKEPCLESNMATHHGSSHCILKRHLPRAHHNWSRNGAVL